MLLVGAFGLEGAGLVLTAVTLLFGMVRTPAHETERGMFRVGIFLDFASSSTRTEGPHGAYVQMSG